MPSANASLKWDLSGGKEVDVIQNAPLKDPIHYRVMGYDVSLRRNDAAMIEVISAAEYAKAQMSQQSEERSADSYILPSTEDLQALAIHKGKTINVALVGNPQLWKNIFIQFCIRSPRTCRQLQRSYC